MDLRRELESLHRASFGWAMACCRDGRPEAEDVLQTVYLKVLEGRARFDGRSSFRTWLFGVIRRTASESRRRRWLHALLLARSREEEGAEEPSSPGADGIVASLEQNRQLLGALRRLSSRQQQVLHLVFYQDLTIEEAAQTLGISLGSARTHFERGKQRLRGELRPQGTL